MLRDLGQGLWRTVALAFRALPRRFPLGQRGVYQDAPAPEAGREHVFSEPDIRLLVEYYKRDNYVKFSVDTISRRVGYRYYLVADDDRALELVNRFLEANSFRELNFKICRDVVLCGNAFLNLVPPDKIRTLHYLPVSSITRIDRDEFGRVVSYQYNWGGVVKQLTPDEVWHFRYNPIDEGAYGEGYVNHMARPGVGYRYKDKIVRRPSLLEIKERIDNASRVVIEKYPQRYIFQVPPGRGRAFTEQYGNLLIGQDMVVEYDVAQIEQRHDSRTRFPEMLDMFDRYMVVGLNNPLIRLITYRGFSYAAAQAAIETLEPDIAAIRDFLKANYERLIAKVLQQHGIDPEKANVKFFWGDPEQPEYDVGDILRAFELGVITREEARTILRNAGWQLEEDSKENMQLTLDGFLKRRYVSYQGLVKPLPPSMYEKIVIGGVKHASGKA